MSRYFEVRSCGGRQYVSTFDTYEEAKAECLRIHDGARQLGCQSTVGIWVHDNGTWKEDREWQESKKASNEDGNPSR